MGGFHAPDSYLPEHLAALRPVIPTIADIKRHHQTAVIEIGKQLSDPPEPVHQAFILTAMHGYNLFEAGVDLILAGRFDVAMYLYRALRDSHALLFSTALSTELAERLLAGNLKAGAARAAAVQIARQLLGDNLADGFDTNLRDEDKAYQLMAHMGASHFVQVLGPDQNGERVPVFGPRAHGPTAVLMMRGFVSDERKLLWYMSLAGLAALPAEWHEECRILRAKAASWLQETDPESPLAG